MLYYFKELISWVKIIPKLIDLNVKQRKEIRDVVGDLADELNRGLQLVAFRIEGAIRIVRSPTAAPHELDAYLSESEMKLSEAFSEFKVCRGFREKRDHFAQLFHPAKAAVKAENIQRIDSLFYELEKDERLISDEVGPLFDELRGAGTAKHFVKIADDCLGQIKKRQKRVKKLARQIHDEL